MRISLLTTLFLSALLSFFINPSSAEAKKKIYNAKVYSTDGKVYRGTLKSATEKGIYLAGKRDTASQFINVSQIKTVKIKAKNAGSAGFFVGAGLGLAAGATGAYLVHENGADKGTNIAATVGGVWLTFITGAIGAKITGHYKEKIYLSGRNEDYQQNLGVIKKYTLEEINK